MGLFEENAPLFFAAIALIAAGFGYIGGRIGAAVHRRIHDD